MRLHWRRIPVVTAYGLDKGIYFVKPLFPQMSDFAARVQRHEDGRRANSEDEKGAREIEEVTTRWLRNCARISKIMTTKWLRKFARISEIMTTKRLCAVSSILRGFTTGLFCVVYGEIVRKHRVFPQFLEKLWGETQVPNFSQLRLICLI